jgi:hypothetical protein
MSLFKGRFQPSTRIQHGDKRRRLFRRFSQTPHAAQRSQPTRPSTPTQRGDQGTGYRRQPSPTHPSHHQVALVSHSLSVADRANSRSHRICHRMPSVPKHHLHSWSPCASHSQWRRARDNLSSGNWWTTPQWSGRCIVYGRQRDGRVGRCRRSCGLVVD